MSPALTRFYRALAGRLDARLSEGVAATAVVGAVHREEDKAPARLPLEGLVAGADVAVAQAEAETGEEEEGARSLAETTSNFRSVHCDH